MHSIDSRDLFKVLGNEYVSCQHEWVINHARRIVCGAAKDVADARYLLEVIGLLDDSGISVSDSTTESEK
jgi:hypothetical protein